MFFLKLALCVLVGFVDAHSLSLVYRRCSLHDEDKRSLCRLPEASILQVLTKRKNVVECSNICEFMNSQQPNYNPNLAYNYTDYFSKLVKNYPSVNIQVNRTDRKEEIHVSNDYFYFNLLEYMPIPSFDLIDSYKACSGFNFFSDSGLCQIFAQSNETGIVSFDNSTSFCSFYKVNSFMLFI